MHEFHAKSQKSKRTVGWQNLAQRESAKVFSSAERTFAISWAARRLRAAIEQAAPFSQDPLLGGGMGSAKFDLTKKMIDRAPRVHDATW